MMRFNDKYLAQGMTMAEAYAARRADRERNAAANAAKRAERLAAVRSCQICGRAILANTGVIAHHGYTRPGEGWQTASCMGARFRPYEVACDALPPAIADCSRYIAQQQAGLADWIANPPAEIKHQRRDAYGCARGAEKTFARPDGFDGATAETNYMADTYIYRFVNARAGFERRIVSSTESLRYLEKRLADWAEFLRKVAADLAVGA